MNSIIQFIRSLIVAAIILGATGTLVEATGILAKKLPKPINGVASVFDG